MQKALVLVSGGLDSATCLALAVKEYGLDNVIALSSYYGQKHDKELEASKKIAEYYNVKRIEIDLTEAFKYSDCTLLKDNNDIPEQSYAEQLEKQKGEPVSTYVPFRNGLFLSVACSIAISNDCSIIYYGAHADDCAGNAYPDTSVSFNNYMASAMWLGSGGKVTLLTPFIASGKDEVVKKGLELGVPFELTWSCYNGRDKACGKCGTCIDRLKAFKANGVSDPIKYEEE